MARQKDKIQIPSRRAFLRRMRWSPLLFLPAPLRLLSAQPLSSISQSLSPTKFSHADYRYNPHYPVKAPIEALFDQILPGSDEFVLEKHAYDIGQLLDQWGEELRATAPALESLGNFTSDSIATASLLPVKEIKIRSANGIEVMRREFAANLLSGKERFLQEMKSALSVFKRLENVELEIVAIRPATGLLNVDEIKIRYELVGTRADSVREQRIGHWLTEWALGESGSWRAVKWQPLDETVSRGHEPVFIDVTSHALGETDSYQRQLIHGVDYWRTILDGASGIDVYGNNGLAVGDIDGDGFDDFYVCQPAGLPNRLYRNRGDGTFEDVTEKSGVGVLDATASAIFADFGNKGVQDLLVVCGSGPLLFLNQGNGKFSLKRDAFKFVQPPQGTFTHASVADYDRDGRLDIYLCLYSYYLGLDQYHYPAPYFDARNGPPNFLLHNEGDGTFGDRTEAAGLNVDNNRYSFASAWGDANGDGWPDLYVVNDFGRNNLYRNNGDGTFTAISGEAGVEDVGAGMSAAWCDFENGGKQDLYAANMWAGAGLRVSEDKNFQAKDPENIRELYRQHARGNALYRNQNDGKFKNVSAAAGIDMGRWAWCSDAWDFDHDGYSDLYIANGYISGADPRNLSSFFWRHVVGNSPSTATPTPKYEQGWQAINELIRSDVSWSGFQRNVFYRNNRDGTFSDVSAIAGLDFVDDSRSFGLADLDHDGRLEVVLKNRNAPQLRILHNVMKELGNSISFRLRGHQSNRDAIGAAVMVEAGQLRQMKYLQAGCGFLSQHTKELFFGVGSTQGTVRAAVRWPNGLAQTFENLPVGHRIEIEEGTESFQSKPYNPSPAALAGAGASQKQESLPASSDTWLIEPLAAPEFSLPDLDGNNRELRSFRGKPLLLHFWATTSPQCLEQSQLFKQSRNSLSGNGLQLVGINLDEPGSLPAVKSFVAQQGIFFPTLLTTPDVAGVYNIICRHLFDRHRNLGIPTSLLLNGEGKIVKIYQGTVNPARAIEDSKSNAITTDDRMRRALPFHGKLFQDAMQRNDFTFGVAFYQHGYLEQAASSFEEVVAAKPDEPDAYYNLGTLYLRRNELKKAQEFLEQAIKRRRDYPEAWNNLGMIAAQQSNNDEAIRNFRQSLQLRPDFAVALLNLGNVYRRMGDLVEAEKLLNHALELEPGNPEVSYALGMLYARQEQIDRALQYLQRAVELLPNYADALNNLGVLLVRAKRYPEANERFSTCIRLEPGYDQAYLNLARLYMLQNDTAKAREVLQELLRLQPQHKVAQQTLEMLH